MKLILPILIIILLSGCGYENTHYATHIIICKPEKTCLEMYETNYGETDKIIECKFYSPRASWGGNYTSSNNSYCKCQEYEFKDEYSYKEKDGGIISFNVNECKVTCGKDTASTTIENRL